MLYEGPYLVTEVISPILYRISGKKESLVLHHDHLRICQAREIPFWLRRKRQQLFLNIARSLSKGKSAQGDHEDPTGLEQDVDEQPATRSLPQVEEEISQDDAEVPARDGKEADADDAGDTRTSHSDEGGEPSVWDEDLGIEHLFKMDPQTKAGRKIRPPRYLSDFLCH
jgi:hypothetical protein